MRIISIGVNENENGFFLVFFVYLEGTIHHTDVWDMKNVVYLKKKNSNVFDWLIQMQGGWFPFCLAIFIANEEYLSPTFSHRYGRQ